MKRRFELFLIALTGLAAIHVCRYELMVYGNEIPKVSPQIRALMTFNDLSSFVKVQHKPNVFRYIVQENASEAYLRFSIPNFDPRHYKLTFSIRAKEALLQDAYIRYAAGRGDGGEKEVADGLARFTIDFDGSVAQMAVWRNGICYVGVAFNKSLLSEGDDVELVGFTFDVN